MRRTLSMVIVIGLLAGCTTSAPYVVKQSTVAGTKTETVCTHKTYLIPWYVGIAGGFFTVKGDRTCEDRVTKLEVE